MSTEDNIQQLQLYEQSVQNILLQKQHLQSELTEIGSALQELEQTSKSYRIIGNIMVEAKQGELISDLTKKKSIAEIRIKALEKQEKTIKEKAESLQSEVMKKMESKSQ